MRLLITTLSLYLENPFIFPLTFIYLFHQKNTQPNAEFCTYRYTRKLFEVTLPALFKYGICLEAHGQNICARFSLSTSELTGFAYRDFGGLKIHMPTLRAQRL